MEFIPLERYSRKAKNKESLKEEKGGKRKKSAVDETSDEVDVKKTKAETRTKVFEKKKVKNKYRETLAMKQKLKMRVPQKKKQKKKGKKEEEDDDDDDDEDDEEVEEEMDVEEEGEEEEDEGEEDEEEEDDEDEEKNEEEALKRKCKEMDEKKKNRLFIRLKKKILKKAQVKELHPDIKEIILPRKKNSRWCWAVFSSEERADEAMKQLIKNKEILVSKPTPYDKVTAKQKEKMKTVLRKKDARKKLEKMWM